MRSKDIEAGSGGAPRGCVLGRPRRAGRPSTELAGATRRDTDPRGRFIAQPEHDRFWEKVHKTPGCWVWTGTRNSDGYGLFRVKRHGRWRYIKAHHWTFEHTHGRPVQPSYTLDHEDNRCRNRACVRPDHLEEVTRAENTRRAAHWRQLHR